VEWSHVSRRSSKTRKFTHISFTHYSDFRVILPPWSIRFPFLRLVVASTTQRSRLLVLPKTVSLASTRLSLRFNGKKR